MVSSIMISYYLKIILFEVMLIKDSIIRTYLSPHVDLHITPTGYPIVLIKWK